MKYTIIRQKNGCKEEQEFDYKPAFKKQRPVALDVLLQARITDMPDLAYRYGCRNGQCGVCTIEVNGKPKLACNCKVREGDRLSAVSTLPVLSDLVVNREKINEQLRGRIPVVQHQAGLASADHSDYHSLNRCIDCYACLNKCPLHEKNNLEACEYRYGNPYAFLKLQRVLVNPMATAANHQAAITAAKELGISECLECAGCSCGVGIDLKKEVIKPLLAACELSGVEEPLERAESFEAY